MFLTCTETALQSLIALPAFAERHSFNILGLPSPQLRAALGLSDDQLPAYIYRMRDLGLPPGWLKAAEINHSGLSM